MNDSSKGLLDVLNYFDLPGAVTTNKGVKCNTTQVKYAIRKKRRKTLRSMKKGYLDKQEKEKTESYVPGGF